MMKYAQVMQKNDMKQQIKIKKIKIKQMYKKKQKPKK